MVRAARHRLATFGGTEIQYSLVTEVPGLPDRSRLRQGVVKAEKPQIITAQILQDRFRGFGADAAQFSEWLASKYGEAIRGLEYQFKNEPHTTRIELTTPDQLVKEISKEFDQQDDLRQALLRGSDKYWELSVMKFIFEETITSFKTNLTELQERGFFDGTNRNQERQHREIRHLINRAKQDNSLVSELGKKLKSYGMFDQYQDEFFQLIH